MLQCFIPQAMVVQSSLLCTRSLCKVTSLNSHELDLVEVLLCLVAELAWKFVCDIVSCACVCV